MEFYTDPQTGKVYVKSTDEVMREQGKTINDLLNERLQLQAQVEALKAENKRLWYVIEKAEGLIGLYQDKLYREAK